MGKQRVTIWLDVQGHPLQAAVALFENDEKATEITWTPEPFADLPLVLEEAAAHLTLQLSLW